MDNIQLKPMYVLPWLVSLNTIVLQRTTAKESLGSNFSAKFGRVLRLLSLALALVIQQSNNYNHKNALMRGRKNSMHRGKELLVARFEVFES